MIGYSINNRYRIVHTIGTGSFAIVYLAVDLLTKNQVAVKCLSKQNLDKRQIEKTLKREILIMRRLGHHHHIVQLLDTYENDDHIFLIMEYCEMDLYEAITQKGGFPEEVVKEVFNQLLDAVIHCHQMGIYHRDIKPENCLISSQYTVKLTDFGLSTAVKWSFEFGCGSVRYMAPECLSNNEDSDGYAPAQNDIWGLGVILINLLFGKNPWHEASMTDPLYSLFNTTNPNILQDQFNLTPEFNSILRSIFHINPKKRCNLYQLKDYISSLQFFTRGAELESLRAISSSSNTLIAPMDASHMNDFPSDELSFLTEALFSEANSQLCVGHMSSSNTHSFKQQLNKPLVISTQTKNTKEDTQPSSTPGSCCLSQYDKSTIVSPVERNMDDCLMSSAASQCFSDVANEEDEAYLVNNAVESAEAITPKEKFLTFASGPAPPSSYFDSVSQDTTLFEELPLINTSNKMSSTVSKPLIKQEPNDHKGKLTSVENGGKSSPLKKMLAMFNVFGTNQQQQDA